MSKAPARQLPAVSPFRESSEATPAKDLARNISRRAPSITPYARASSSLSPIGISIQMASGRTGTRGNVKRLEREIMACFKSLSPGCVVCWVNGNPKEVWGEHQLEECPGEIVDVVNKGSPYDKWRKDTFNFPTGWCWTCGLAQVSRRWHGIIVDSAETYAQGKLGGSHEWTGSDGCSWRSISKVAVYVLLTHTPQDLESALRDLIPEEAFNDDNMMTKWLMTCPDEYSGFAFSNFLKLFHWITLRRHT
jgi:hypothetical protein